MVRKPDVWGTWESSSGTSVHTDSGAEYIQYRLPFLLGSLGIKEKGFAVVDVFWGIWNSEVGITINQV